MITSAIFVKPSLRQVDLTTGLLAPSPESDPEVHDSQERVHCILLVDQGRLNGLILYLDSAFLLNLESQFKDTVLSLQFEFFHLRADLAVAISASHAPIKQLVEVNIAVIALDAHLEHLFLQFTHFVVVSSETERCLSVLALSERPEKLRQLLFLDLQTSILLLSLVLPTFHETVKIPLESHKHVVFWQVVSLELLNDDENEEIEHYVRASQHNEVEVDE